MPCIISHEKGIQQNRTKIRRSKGSTKQNQKHSSTPIGLLDIRCRYDERRKFTKNGGNNTEHQFKKNKIPFYSSQMKPETANINELTMVDRIKRQIITGVVLGVGAVTSLISLFTSY